MARTLPWLKGQAQNSHHKASARPAKRQRIQDLDSVDDDAPSTAALSPSRRNAIVRPDRTPSTSPPPAPPDEEFMHEGLDHDDIYIMVEDEFQAVARTFTQHLHHAEYQRLKNRAKAQNASAIISTISRPTDSITEMREETKRKKEAEHRSTKLKAILGQIKDQAAAKRPSAGSDSDEGSDTEIAKDGDDGPWVGTTLQGLMTSPSKKQTSLTGLQSVKSSTRAAAGYSKPESLPPRTSNVFDLAPKKTNVIRKPSAKTPEIHSNDDDDSTTGEDDDLNVPIRRQKPPPTQTTTKKPTSIQTSPPQQKNPPNTTTTTLKNHTHPKPLPALPKKPTPQPSTSTSTSNNPLPTISFSPTFPKPSALPGNASKRRLKRMMDLRKARAAKEEERNKGGGGINEIPIFLA